MNGFKYFSMFPSQNNNMLVRNAWIICQTIDCVFIYMRVLDSRYLSCHRNYRINLSIGADFVAMFRVFLVGCLEGVSGRGVWGGCLEEVSGGVPISTNLNQFEPI